MAAAKQRIIDIDVPSRHAPDTVGMGRVLMDDFPAIEFIPAFS